MRENNWECYDENNSDSSCCYGDKNTLNPLLWKKKKTAWSALQRSAVGVFVKNFNLSSSIKMAQYSEKYFIPVVLAGVDWFKRKQWRINSHDYIENVSNFF